MADTTSQPNPTPASKTAADRLDDMANVMRILAFLTLVAGVIGAGFLGTYSESNGFAGDENPHQGLAVVVGLQAIAAGAVLYTLALLAEVVASIKGTAHNDASPGFQGL